MGGGRLAGCLLYVSLLTVKLWGPSEVLALLQPGVLQ